MTAIFPQLIYSTHSLGIDLEQVMWKDLQYHFLQNEYINERMNKMSFQSTVTRHINRRLFFQEIHLKLSLLSIKYKRIAKHCMPFS